MSARKHESMKDNKNAETWTEESAKELFEKAIAMAGKDSKYDFIGEVARELGTYRDVFKYLKDKYKALKPLHKRLLTNLEANCFSHGKDGNIVASLAIMNLKSNCGWTDRAQVVTDSTVKIEVPDTIKDLLDSEDGEDD